MGEIKEMFVIIGFKIQIKLNQVSQVKQHSHTEGSGGLMVQALSY